MTAYTETADGLAIPRPLRPAVGADRYDALLALYESRLLDLEMQLAEDGWQRLNEQGAREFSRAALGRIIDLARVFYLKNPIVNRAVEIGALYVWGQDLSVNAADPGVQAVVDRFWRDNAATLTGQRASRGIEVELEVTGNVFLALFPDRVTGQVRVRTVPVEEIARIVCNPDDRAEVWYYRREWSEDPLDGGAPVARAAYYPDWHYDAGASKPEAIGDVEIRWDSPIVHVKAGAFPHWRWGVPEVYAALDWAKTYKEQLEDDATRSRNLARLAWKAKTKGGKQGVAAMKAKLGTTYAGAGLGSLETNPPPLSGSTAIMDDSIDIDPIRLAGATLDPDHSRPARQMAAAALGVPDHFFDANQSNLATSKTLDRPTELRFSERRAMWRDVFADLIAYALGADLAASRGLLPKSIAEEARAVDLAWPSLLEPDILVRVQAVVQAATLAGSQPADTMPAELVSRLLMAALEVEDIDGELKKLEAEQADKAATAAALAKQMQPQPPAPGQQPGQPGTAPVAPAEALAEAKPAAVVITDAELEDARQWWDERFPDLKNVLGKAGGDG